MVEGHRSNLENRSPYEKEIFAHSLFERAVKNRGKGSKKKKKSGGKRKPRKGKRLLRGGKAIPGKRVTYELVPKDRVPPKVVVLEDLTGLEPGRGGVM